MKTLKLFLAVTVMASLLAIPCTTSFARDTVSNSNPAAVHVVKKEVVKKEQGFIEKIFDGIGNAFKSVVNYFVADKPVEKTTATEQQKIVGQSTVQPAQQAVVNIPEIKSEVAASPAKVAEPVDVPQVQQQVQIQTQVQNQQPSVSPPAPTSPSTTHATTSPVITVTQSPKIVTPQYVEQKNDFLGLSKIEVEEKIKVPEHIDDVKEQSITAKSDVPVAVVKTETPTVATVQSKPIIKTKVESSPAPTTSERDTVTTTQTTTSTRGTATAQTTAGIRLVPGATVPVTTTMSSARETATATTGIRPTATTTATTTATAGTRETAATTTDTRETATATTGIRPTTTTATTTATAGTRETAATQPVDSTRTITGTTTATTRTTTSTEPTAATRETLPVTEPDARSTSHTETFEGQTIVGMTIAPVETFAIVDTIDNVTTNIRTFVVSLPDEVKVECPAQQATTTTRQTAAQTTTETTQAGVQETAPIGTLRTGEALSAQAPIPASDTLTQRAATTTKVLTTAGTLAGGVVTTQQAQALSDVLKAEMLAQCPTIQRLPAATTETGSGARFITTTENGGRLIYVTGTSVRTVVEKRVGEEAPPEDIPPKLDVVATPVDCQATLEAKVFCSETVDCTQEFEFNASFKVGNTEMNDFVTKINNNTFLIAPPKEPVETVKGLSISLNKANLEGPVVITITAKKGEDVPLEHIVDDVSNKEDLIARCIQVKASTEGGSPKAYDETTGERETTGHDDISGGGGCSLIRR